MAANARRGIVFVERNSDIDSIDLTSRNKFKWEWLVLKDENVFYVRIIIMYFL